MAKLFLDINKQRSILVIGSGGQLGRAICSQLATRELAFDALGRESLDLSELAELKLKLAALYPCIIINAAAFTQVDEAENQADVNNKLNWELPKTLADWCHSNNAVLIHYSTDYVYSGDGEQAWREEDKCEPANAYGMAKLVGDQSVEASGCRFLIFRTSWVYDERGKNFVNTMLKLGSEKKNLAVVADQVGAPTYAFDLAQASVEALLLSINRKDFPSGIYHLVNSGWTSWWGFAVEIFAQARARGIILQVQEVTKISSDEIMRPARRPRNSRLNSQKFVDTFGFRLPDWTEGLTRCLEAKYEGR